jgi:ubiquinone/menaquinone biosynthesis C-methylase UbiE
VNLMDKTVETYNKIAKEYSETRLDPKAWAKEFKIFSQLINGKKVIDIGCGAGRDAVLFVENGFDYTGIDASREMVKMARERVVGGRILLMDFYELDFPKNSFDGFWAAASILHVPKAKAAEVLRGIWETIKPGGVGFISIKEKKSTDERVIKENKYGGIERFFAFYDREEFQELLIHYGFSVVGSYVLKGDDTNWLCYFVEKV